MSRIIYKYDCYCNICKELKKVVCFEEEQPGYEGYMVSFDICKDCYDDIYNNDRIIKN